MLVTMNIAKSLADPCGVFPAARDGVNFLFMYDIVSPPSLIRLVIFERHKLSVLLAGVLVFIFGVAADV